MMIKRGKSRDECCVVATEVTTHNEAHHCYISNQNDPDNAVGREFTLNCYHVINCYFSQPRLKLNS